MSELEQGRGMLAGTNFPSMKDLLARENEGVASACHHVIASLTGQLTEATGAS